MLQDVSTIHCQNFQRSRKIGRLLWCNRGMAGRAHKRHQHHRRRFVLNPRSSSSSLSTTGVTTIPHRWTGSRAHRRLLRGVSERSDARTKRSFCAVKKRASPDCLRSVAAIGVTRQTRQSCGSLASSPAGGAACSVDDHAIRELLPRLSLVRQFEEAPQARFQVFTIARSISSRSLLLRASGARWRGGARSPTVLWTAAGTRHLHPRRNIHRMRGLASRSDSRSPSPTTARSRRSTLASSIIL